MHKSANKAVNTPATDSIPICIMVSPFDVSYIAKLADMTRLVSKMGVPTMRNVLSVAFR